MTKMERFLACVLQGNASIFSASLIQNTFLLTLLERPRVGNFARARKYCVRNLQKSVGGETTAYHHGGADVRADRKQEHQNVSTHMGALMRDLDTQLIMTTYANHQCRRQRGWWLLWRETPPIPFLYGTVKMLVFAWEMTMDTRWTLDRHTMDTTIDTTIDTMKTRGFCSRVFFVGKLRN